MKKYFLTLLGFVLPLGVFAATIGGDVTLVLPDTGDSYIIENSSFDTLTVNPSTFEFIMNAGDGVRLHSTDRRTLTNTLNSSITCGSSESSVHLQLSAGASQTTVTVTPSGTCSTASTGGGGIIGGGGGGGGGGGASAPTIPPQTPATTTPATVPPVTPPAPAPVPAQVPTPTPPAPAPVITSKAELSKIFIRDLALGATGDDVSQLQALLASDTKIYPEGKVTGYFGSLTVAAVRRFQAKYGLPQPGRVGPLTREKLLEVFGAPEAEMPPVPVPEPEVPLPPKPSSVSSEFTRGLGLGSRHEDVKRLQQLLNSDPDTRIAVSGVGSSGNETTIFGSLTKAAVEKFQVKYGLAKAGDPGYGFVGPKTRAKLKEVFAGVPVEAPPAPVPPPAPTPPPAPAPVPTPPPPAPTSQEELPSFLKLFPAPVPKGY